MYDLDNQITCMINEAFPNIDIEEIENWDVEKTMKYFTRAEWKLHNLRGISFIDPEEEQKIDKIAHGKKVTTSDKAHNGRSKKEKLTPENIGAESGKKVKALKKDKSGMTYEEFIAKFPEFANDSVMSEGMNAFKNKEVSDLPPALRVGL